MISGWVRVIGPPAAIWRRNRGTTEPEEPSTPPRAPQRVLVFSQRGPAPPIQPDAWTLPSRWWGGRLCRWRSAPPGPRHWRLQHGRPDRWSPRCWPDRPRDWPPPRGRVYRQPHGNQMHRLLGEQALQQLRVSGTAQHRLSALIRHENGAPARWRRAPVHCAPAESASPATTPGSDGRALNQSKPAPVTQTTASRMPGPRSWGSRHFIASEQIFNRDRPQGINAEASR